MDVSSFPFCRWENSHKSIKVKQLAQDHPPREYQSEDSNPGPPQATSPVLSYCSVLKDGEIQLTFDADFPV